MRILFFHIFNLIWCIHLHDSTNGLTSSSVSSNRCLLRPYTLGLTDFQAVFFFLEQNRKYEAVHILTYLPRLDTGARPNGKSGYVCVGPVPGGNLISSFTDANVIAEFYSLTCSLLYDLHVSLVNRSRNIAVKRCPHRRFREPAATSEEWKHIYALYLKKLHSL